MLIAFTGPVGSGKTTLANQLTELMTDAVILREDFESIPLLEHSAHLGRATALETTLSFLILHATQLKQAVQFNPSGRVIVADFFMEDNDCFARHELSAQQLSLYQSVKAQLQQELPPYDLVIRLDVPEPVCWQQIQQRGRSFELAIGRDFYAKVHNSYQEKFARPAPNAVTLQPAVADNSVEENRQQLSALLKRFEVGQSGCKSP